MIVWIKRVSGVTRVRRTMKRRILERRRKPRKKNEKHLTGPDTNPRRERGRRPGAPQPAKALA